MPRFWKQRCTYMDHKMILINSTHCVRTTTDHRYHHAAIHTGHEPRCRARVVVDDLREALVHHRMYRLCPCWLQRQLDINYVDEWWSGLRVVQQRSSECASSVPLNTRRQLSQMRGIQTTLAKRVSCRCQVHALFEFLAQSPLGLTHPWTSFPGHPSDTASP